MRKKKEEKKEAETEEDICCVCGHSLSTHIDEKEWWRCHSLGADAYQCECRLVKLSDDSKLIDYDLKHRVDDHLKEFREGHG